MTVCSDPEAGLLASGMYQCPGEKYQITREQHLGRLANFYDKCHDCPACGDTGTLSVRQVRHLQAARRHAESKLPFDADGLCGDVPGSLEPNLARQFARALGITWHAGNTHQQPPLVLVGHDGRALTGDLVAAVHEGLRWAGCRVADVGGVTSAGLLWRQHRSEAQGAILIGNSQGLLHTASVRAWDAAGTPLDRSHGLHDILRLAATEERRPSRHAGNLVQHADDFGYSKRFDSFFYALRPLTVVLLTTSLPILYELHRLTSRVGLRMILNPRPEAAIETGQLLTSMPAAAPPSPALPPSILGKLVPDRRAHFGFWIDGDGERCLIVDEQGREVPSPALLPCLERLAAPTPNLAPITATSITATSIISTSTSTTSTSATSTSPFTMNTSTCEVHESSRLSRVFDPSATRAVIAQSMQHSGTMMAADPAGRFWFAGPPPLPDALFAFALLLTLLSQSDEPLSCVVANA